MMRPDQCGTAGVPKGHPAYLAVETFKAFLAEYHEVERTEDPARLAAFNERWGDYIAGDAAGPTVTDTEGGTSA